MIAQLSTFQIHSILLEDAKGINALMVTNANRFGRYFPGTLAQNTSLVLSETFAKNKRSSFKGKTEFLFTIKDNTTKQIIGLVYIKELDWTIKQGEFAYCMDANFGGKQIMSQAIEALTNYAFETLGLETLQIIAHKDNMPSVKVALNTSFKWVKTLLKEFTPNGEAPLDMELYERYKLNKKH